MVLEDPPLPPLPPAPPLPEGLRVLIEDIPEEIMKNVERDVERLLDLPFKMDRDMATLLAVISKHPGLIGDMLYQLPSDAPQNIDGLMLTVKEGFEYDETVDRGERLRRITDVIDLFTPT